MDHPPADALIDEISAYLVKNQESLPVDQARMLQKALDALHDLKARPPDAPAGTKWTDVANVAIRLLEYLADGALLDRLRGL